MTTKSLHFKTIFILIHALLISSCVSQKHNPYISYSNKELLGMYGTALRSSPVEHCNKLLPIAKEIHERTPDNPSFRNIFYFSKSNCASSDGRHKDAYATIKKLEQESRVSSQLLGVKRALKAKEYADAINRLETISKDNNNLALRNQEPREAWSILRDFQESDKKTFYTRALELFTESPHFEYFDLDLRSSLAFKYLDNAANIGEFRNPVIWVNELLSRFSLSSMLGEKKFQQIWPTLSFAAGQNLTKVMNKNINERISRFENNPSNHKYYQQAAHALFYAGEFEQVSNFVTTPETNEFHSVTKDQAWALNIKAYALDRLNRQEEATRIFDNLASLSPSNRPWLINFTINRAERLLLHGDWRKSYDAAIFSEKTKGSDYAKMIIRRVKACAQFKLGNIESSQAILDVLYKRREDSYTNAIYAHLCAEQEQQAIHLTLEALRSDKHRDSILYEMQKPEFTSVRKPPNFMVLHSLLENPEVLTEFNKYSRLIPEEFMPLF